MRELASSSANRPIGCTQSTEIISTEGVQLCGALPKGCELATMYTAAATTSAASPNQAQILIELLTSTESGELRRRAGFIG
jgi:molybdate transport system substrate-binding protein